MRSDLIREFESRGVRVAQLEREQARSKYALVEAETKMTLAESEKQKWRDAVTELERQRDARAPPKRARRRRRRRARRPNADAPIRGEEGRARPRTRDSLARTRKRSV